MLMGTDVGGISTLRDDSCVGPLCTVSIKLVPAVGLVVLFALAAVEAGI